MQEITEDTLIGLFAVSRAGHDRGNYYMIVGETEQDVYVADGKLRTMENPKRKNKKHVQIMKKGCGPEMKNKLLNDQTVYNEEVKYLIKSNFKFEMEGLYVEV